MSFSVLTSFALASFILAIAPGPDNIFVLTQSALYGVKKGIAVIIGLCLGILIQTLCLVVGLSAFISAVPALMIVIKLIGVAYLCYLAYQAIKASRALSRESSQAAASAAGAGASADAGAGAKADAGADNHSRAHNKLGDISYRRLVYRGLIMNITNPKVQLFFLSFFPQFLPSSAQGMVLAAYMALLGAIFLLMTLIVFCSIALFSGTLSSYFNSPSFNIKLNYSAAFIFLALAVFTLLTLTE
ncbi:LysE family translocator [Anaerobiospirillum sp. NML120448]|uniref:LysE family translocator n=1 Tax=Anaerobiospirillum sp. NML120448 TaxID=2932816 RepID=UPI001FF6D792|nr:LysE family translocator [Anaerobiospirillum sp. NML120448]MCK0515391.1 LysE family translocator [Anaerobiospirillum sp. NML120448]